MYDVSMYICMYLSTYVSKYVYTYAGTVQLMSMFTLYTHVSCIHVFLLKELVKTHLWHVSYIVKSPV